MIAQKYPKDDPADCYLTNRLKIISITLRKVYTMKTLQIFLLALLLHSAAKMQGQDWSPIADMGDARYRAVSFTLAGQGYVIVGQTSNTTKRSTWAYDPVAGTWSQKADFGGGNRRVAFGFAIADKGYVGTGRDDNGTNGNGNLHNDFWEYDPEANVWIQKANFPGGNRETAIAFSIGEYGYAGLGLAGSRKYDFYKYDPTANVWTTLQPLNSGYHLYDTAIFTLNGRAYFSTGSGFRNVPYGNYTSAEVIRYDPQNDSWTKLNDFTGGARQRATAFTVNGTAYLGLGWTGVYKSDIWQYNEAADTWTPAANFPLPGRGWVSRFTIDDKVFVGNGVSLNSMHDEFFIWQPSLSTAEVAQGSSIITTRPGEFVFNFKTVGSYNIEVHTVNGVKVLDAAAENIESTALRHNLSKGIYVISIYNSSNGQKAVKKVLVP